MSTDPTRGNRDLDDPLGQSAKPKAGRSFRVSRSHVAGSLILVAVVAGAGYSAFLGEPLRAPTEPEEPPVVAEVTDPEATDAPAPVASGPAVIKVTPDGAAPAADNAASSNSVLVIRDPSAVTQNPRMAHLPDRSLVKKTDYGQLPVTAADGRRPFDVYAGPWSGRRGARVAIVIGGMGLSQTGTQAAIAKLPSEVTLGFATQGNSLGRWMQTARQEGHEIILQVPLEPFDYPQVNPGRNTLTIDAATSGDLTDLYWALGRTTNYTGIMNHMGARLLSDGSALTPVMAELGKRGLMFLDDGSTARSAASSLAPVNKVPFAAGDAVIDLKQSRGDILEALDGLEATARARGYAIGTGSAFDVTVDTVAEWVREARKRGIEIVPVSALAADPK